MDSSEFDHLVAFRRDLHAHPQLAFEEHYAAQRIRERLDALGVPHTAAAGQTGVVAWLRPSRDDAARRPGVALRADTDALPIEEATDVPWGSQHAGCMHACGHDGHATILLGVAEQLAARRDALPRPVKLLFQPAEETGGGAARMIADGALDQRLGGIEVQRIFSVHNWPHLPVGTVGGRAGLSFAGNDRFVIRIDGEGGHAALPHLTSDPIVAAAQLIQAAQSIVSRNISPTDLAAVTVAQIHAGHTHNVIPTRVELEGSIRYGSQPTRDRIAQRLDQLLKHTAQSHDLVGHLHIEPGYPPLHNDPHCIDQWRTTTRQACYTWQELASPLTGSEDFAFYTRAIPGAMVLIGAADPAHTAALHTPAFDFNDATIPIGVRLLTDLAMDEAWPGPS